MAANIGWYDTDDTTPLASIDLGAIPPGQDYYTRNSNTYKEVRAKNDGTVNLASVTAEIQQAGAYAAYSYLRIATGAGTPGAFVDHTTDPLALGAITVGSAVSVWINAIVPGGADPEVGQVANLVLLGTV